MNVKKTIIVDVSTDTDTGCNNVSVGFPTDNPLDVRESAHTLAAGISMLIRTCDTDEMGIKSHELMNEVIEHLNEYVNIDSYSDSNANPIMKIKK